MRTQAGPCPSSLCRVVQSLSLARPTVPPGVDRSMPFYIALGGGGEGEVSGARWGRAGVGGGQGNGKQERNAAGYLKLRPSFIAVVMFSIWSCYVKYLSPGTPSNSLPPTPTPVSLPPPPRLCPTPAPFPFLLHPASTQPTLFPSFLHPLPFLSPVPFPLLPH